MTKKTIKLLVIACGFFGYTMLGSAQSNKVSVAFPDGYRLWTHVKSGIVGPDSPAHGLHHIYANAAAMEGFRTGRFNDGSTIVFDVLALDANNDVGERRYIDVMQKDSVRFVKTGGWGFEEFRGNSNKTEPALNETDKIGCFNCHVKQKQHDYVFSSFRE